MGIKPFKNLIYDTIRDDAQFRETVLNEALKEQSGELMSLALRDFSQALGIGQNELARRTGLSPAAINKIFKGGNPTFDTFVKLLDAMGLSIKITAKPKRKRMPEETKSTSSKKAMAYKT